MEMLLQEVWQGVFLLSGVRVGLGSVVVGGDRTAMVTAVACRCASPPCVSLSHHHRQARLKFPNDDSRRKEHRQARMALFMKQVP